ncbi:MAG: 3-dehydroquinate synthase [Actinobacteria bacterium]|nr:3-dehydroquinate synthase [Actinomycetota bacterium]
MAEIRIRSSVGEYPVLIGRDLYENELPDLIGRIRPTSVAVVSHASIMGLHGKRLIEAIYPICGGENGVFQYLFAEGEENKNLSTVEDGYEVFLASGINREGLVVAFGGGVVGDLAGFLAATYMRGTRLLQVPTTLMAMVDSSVGGKVGVDLKGAKNAVGTFYQPQAVLSDVGVLGTLPERELRGGMVEIAKYGLLYDEIMLQKIGKWHDGLPENAEELDGVIAACVAHKADVVTVDERDLTGKRAMLNYGHTFGHALETATAYIHLRHGEAVGIGMLMAARLSELCGLAGEGLHEYHRCVLMPILKDVVFPRDLDAGRIVNAMQSDKKKGHVMRFVLLQEPQEPRLVESPGEALIMRAVADIMRDMKGD